MYRNTYVFLKAGVRLKENMLPDPEKHLKHVFVHGDSVFVQE
jgi:hypothetical protein